MLKRKISSDMLFVIFFDLLFGVLLIDSLNGRHWIVILLCATGLAIMLLLTAFIYNLERNPNATSKYVPGHVLEQVCGGGARESSAQESPAMRAFSSVIASGLFRYSVLVVMYCVLFYDFFQSKYDSTVINSILFWSVFLAPYGVSSAFFCFIGVSLIDLCGADAGWGGSELATVFMLFFIGVLIDIIRYLQRDLARSRFK